MTNIDATIVGRAVKLVSDGFLRPAGEGVEEPDGGELLTSMRVEGLSEPLQYFHCRVTRGLDQSTAEIVLVDDGPAECRGAVERCLASRFPGSAAVFLRSQRTGLARVACPASSDVEEDAAAAVAVVMCSVAWDDSEVIVITANENIYKMSVELVDDTHWAMRARAYPIGTPGVPWSDAERAEWRSQQPKRRSYADDVLRVVERLRERFDVQRYGELAYEPDRYELFALRSRGWNDALPCVLVTGGVHGYETSGVHGALQFLEAHAADYADRINLLVAPCVSPWGYERIQRWNPNAVDPNRSFRAESAAGESAALMRLLAPMRDRWLMHIDLHETTDTDESELRPALAARDGVPFIAGEIPDGFYLCGDSEALEPEFQRAIIDAVAKVTHIAQADSAGELIGSPQIAPGVIHYPYRQLGLCAGVTAARYRTTTEVYPDSSRATPEQCNAAQIAAVRAAIDFVLMRNHVGG